MAALKAVSKLTDDSRLIQSYLTQEPIHVLLQWVLVSKTGVNDKVLSGDGDYFGHPSSMY